MPAAFLLLFAACSVAQSAQGPPATADAGPERPHILFLMADQMRGDFLGCAGNAAVHSPNLDRLAAEGVRFARAYSSTPSCTPARAAVLTGQSPWGHGMLGYSRVAPEYPHELPRLMDAAGYYPYAIGKNHFHPQRNLHGYRGAELDESGRVQSEDFESDYRRWFRETAPDLDPDATGVGWNDYPAKAYVLDERLHPTRWTGDRAVAFLEGYDRDQPFFLKVSFARPHSPYDPPQRLLDAVAPETLPRFAAGPWSEADHGSFHQPDQWNAARNKLGAETTQASRRAYAASIAFIDEQVGRILGTLERRGMLEHTVILFTSDHGDMLGDHHLWRKTYAYEGSAGVPMLLSWGEQVLEAERGQTRPELVELRDLLPTFLDVAGAPVPETVEGRSLFDPVRGTGPPWRQLLDLEHSTCYWKGNNWTALTDARWKYIWFAPEGKEQLFDLATDPQETKDLAADPEYAEVLLEWRGRMAEHLAPRGEGWVEDGAPAVREGPTLLGPNYPGR